MIIKQVGSTCKSAVSESDLVYNCYKITKATGNQNFGPKQSYKWKVKTGHSELQKQEDATRRDKDKLNNSKAKMSKAVNNMNMGIVEPQERMKNLSHCGTVIEVDKNMAVSRWVHHGICIVHACKAVAAH